jgi:hypothetical protein
VKSAALVDSVASVDAELEKLLRVLEAADFILVIDEKAISCQMKPFNASEGNHKPELLEIRLELDVFGKTLPAAAEHDGDQLHEAAEA